MKTFVREFEGGVTEDAHQVPEHLRIDRSRPKWWGLVRLACWILSHPNTERCCPEYYKPELVAVERESLSQPYVFLHPTEPYER